MYNVPVTKVVFFQVHIVGWLSVLTAASTFSGADQENNLNMCCNDVTPAMSTFE